MRVWTTGGLTVIDRGWPRKLTLSASVSDGDALTFGLELVRGRSGWRIYADVSVGPTEGAEPQVVLAMEQIDCSTMDNAATGLTLASGWLQSVIVSRPPTRRLVVSRAWRRRLTEIGWLLLLFRWSWVVNRPVAMSM